MAKGMRQKCVTRTHWLFSGSFDLADSNIETIFYALSQMTVSWVGGKSGEETDILEVKLRV